MYRVVPLTPVTVVRVRLTVMGGQKHTEPLHHSLLGVASIEVIILIQVVPVTTIVREENMTLTEIGIIQNLQKLLLDLVLIHNF